MPRNGSGTYALPSGQPVSTGTVISSTVHNTFASDIATALTASVAKDGQTTATANLPMGTFKHTGVGDASARTQYGSAGQICDNSLRVLGSVAGTNAVTANLTPAITAYVAGQKFYFVPANANTSTVTIAINGLAAKAIVKGSASTALAANDLVTTCFACVIYDGTSFVLLNPATNSLTGTLTIGMTEPVIILSETDAGTNGKRWRWVVDAGVMSWQVINDGDTSGANIMQVTRTGVTVDSIALTATTVTVNGATVTGVSRVVKAADETVNNSATLQDDDHLTMTVAAGTYIAELVLLGTAANNTPGIKLQLTYAGSFTASPKSHLIGAISGGGSPSVTFLTTVAGLGTPYSNSLWTTVSGGEQWNLRGVLTLTGGGTLKLQWAQSTAHASNTVISAGSYLQLTKIA